jgi:cyclophilin family peptidyl-prolyl cis-trans isomerase/HEAT repeat protein
VTLKRLVVLALPIVVTLACKPPATPAPAPAAAPAPPPPPVVSLDRKVAWILRLEQQRTLRDLAGGATAPASLPDLEAAASTRLTLKAAYLPDLVDLASDPDGAVRRRAVLAIGRAGVPDGAATLVSSLNDAEAEVRGTAAFALGLLGQKSTVPALVAALKDSSPLVRGRAAEGLGLIADPSAAPAIADAFSGCKSEIGSIEPDDESAPKSPAIDACRLALLALVPLKNYDALARVALDEQGQPISTWWPVAYALQRIGDPKTAPALVTLLGARGVYTPSFALRGLATAKDARVVQPALAFANRANADVRLRVSAVRALAQVGGPDVTPALLKLLVDRTTPKNLALEIVTAIGTLRDKRAFDPILDLVTDPWPAMRLAALTSAARIDPDGFLIVVSSLDRDKEWSVRAGLASILATLPADRVRDAIRDLASDQDVRVSAPALEGLAKTGSPDLTKRLFDAMDSPDFGMRATAARLMGESRPEGGAARLAAAYARAETEPTYVPREAALEALAKYGAAEARETLTRALADRDWPVRLRAAELLRGLGQPAAAPERPAVLRQPLEFFESERVLHPKFSPHAFLETKLGTIEIELNVVDAPFTTASFVDLARAGFFNGVRVHRLVANFVIQAGDPRSDGEGGPGYTIRDELSTQPYVRGTVGMALAGPDTGGSQFFITLSPQPHLDGKYAVFGKVVNGWDVLDQIAQWDVIERVKIWDGVTIQ